MKIHKYQYTVYGPLCENESYTFGFGGCYSFGEDGERAIDIIFLWWEFVWEWTERIEK